MSDKSAPTTQELEDGIVEHFRKFGLDLHESIIRITLRAYGDTRERAGIERAKEAARGVAGVPRHTWNDYMNRRWEGAMDCVRAIESLPVPAPVSQEPER